MLFSKIAVCRHQAGCMLCAFWACVGIQCILLCMPKTKEHDSWEHTLHESLHMTHKSFTFVATFSQMACTHTFISNTTLKYNSRHKVQIVNVSSSWFIRHYQRNPVQFS